MTAAGPLQPAPTSRVLRTARDAAMAAVGGAAVGGDGASGASRLGVEIPPTLVRMDPPLLLEGPPEIASAAAAAAARRVAVHGAEAGIDDIINSILPPRLWTQRGDGTTWMQYVSKEPSTRMDVLALNEALDERLAQRQAKPDGICPVREDIHRQCFDELIRQVAVSSPERGLLLLRVRDEIRMTTDAYKALYDSSVTFGVRKQVQAEAGIPEMEAAISELGDRKKALESSILTLRNRLELIERRQAERRLLEEKRRAEELAYLRHQAKHLDMFLKSIPKL